MNFKIHQYDKLKLLINEEINKFVFDQEENKKYVQEMLDKPTKREYEKILDQFYDYYYYDIYRFKSILGNTYDVDFIKDSIDISNMKLNDGNRLSSIFKNTKIELYKIIDLGFTLTENKNIEVNPNDVGTMKDPYVKRSDNNEVPDVLNTVSYMILEYIKNNPKILIYSIGTNTYKTNIKVYNYIFDKSFSNNYSVFESKNPNYEYGSYFYINKKVLK